ncbi:MAG: methylated-DNA--[protein]-cysteine S-methyltransferase [Nitrospirae bacterium]|nr:methylated-DNA--[protein]-cysteine S-methyltransferase [Nitrospirota bacterium]
MKSNRSALNDYYDSLQTPIGTLYLAFRASSLISLSFDRPHAVAPKQTKISAVVRKELSEYFEQGRRDFTFKTAFLEGTGFEQEVWNSLKEIPYGETRTYKWIADRIGKPLASRAVGNALGKNPIPIVFPCHRVVESDGSIGGYTPGVDIKRRLLEIEYYVKLSKT